MRLIKKNTYLLLTILFSLVGSISVFSESASAGSYYVAKDGSGQFLTIQAALNAAQSGEILIVKSGAYNELISFPRQGVTLKAMNGEVVTITQSGRVMNIDQPNLVIEGFILDGNWGASDAVVISSNANNLVLRNVEIKNSARDCVDMAAPANVLIEGSKIHDCIWVEVNEITKVTTRNDAHGIVTLGVKGLTIRNTEIYYVSGDAIQLQYGGWDNVLVEGCRFWNTKLPSARGGAPANSYIGENAIDTKYCEKDGRGRIYLKNITAYGWHSDYIENAAAFNLKHNIYAEADGITCYESEICFRARGPGPNGPNSNCGDTPLGGAWATIKNAVMYNSDKGVRYEDSIQNLHLYNNIFGNNLVAFFNSAGGYGSGFDVKNNLFYGSSKPSEASHSSNLAAASGFVNPATNDYHPLAGASWIDAGIDIAEVIIDRDANRRISGEYDVGAFEYKGVSDTTPPAAPSGLTVR